MTLVRQRHTVMGIGLGLILGLVIMAAFSGMAHGKQFLSEEKILPAHYPKQFDGLGRIDRIGRHDIVIDDTMHDFSHHVTFATPRTKNGSKGEFREGTYVGYVTDGEKKITSLWLIE